MEREISLRDCPDPSGARGYPLLGGVPIILNEKFPQYISGIYGTSLAYFITRLPEKQILVILPSEEEAESLAIDINTFLNSISKHGENTEAVFFPDLNKIGDLPASKETIGERLKIFVRIEKGENIIVTSSAKAIEESYGGKRDRQYSQKKLLDNLIAVKINDSLNISDFTDRLIKSGYEREYLVENKGQWSIRGGIIDVYPVDTDYPVRIELDSDRVFSIRSFDVFTQKTESQLTSFEFFLDIPGEESVDLPGYFNDNIIIMHEQSIIKQDIQLDGRKIIYTSALDYVAAGQTEKTKFSVRSSPPFTEDLNLLKNEIKSRVKDKYDIVIFSLNEAEKSRLIEIFGEIGIFNEIEGNNRIKFEIGYISTGFIWKEMNLAVFSDHEIFNRYSTRIKGRKYRIKKGKASEAGSKQRLKLGDLVDMKAGDYVVHSDYGIGRFLGISRIEVDGCLRDFLTIEYEAESKLHVPFYRIDVVSKYIGDKEPIINSIFTSRWHRTKEYVKEKAKKIAKELIELYAAREILHGHAFSSDTHWQKEFEASFIYEETEDQLKAINEVKDDMENIKPMDRLVCGDVGYGKTEVAMRAAFKAVMDKKQVAVLAPTTILVEQHYNTFRERMADYPINIDMLSRFRTRAEQKKTLENMSKGLVDIIIGTHRLLQKDIKFHDLGLVVVDEEQRFGVRAKETLKQLRKNVDVLTLTATPIPRTLHTALSGIKKISVINTSPEGRIPIETYCFPYNDKTIKEAIEKEINRNGQVFYLYNRIEDIEKKKEKIKSLLDPVRNIFSNGARVAIAHGRIKSHNLEKTMKKFLNMEYNVLLSTTIIENGLDMPNVNTIVIENSHTFGLSELYQLRGRIGRGLRKAYAYITYPEDAALSLGAIERLKAIEESSELGAGFKIALKDLEIRGAGNIIGVEQHGYIAKIGFDLYTQLLAEAIEGEIKQPDVTSERKEAEPEISIKVDAYIPDTYINNDIQKINTYRKIAAIKEESEVSKLKNEIIDIYGKIPVEAENLFCLMEIKILAIKKNVKLIKESEGDILIEYHNGNKLSIPIEANTTQPGKISSIISRLKNNFKKYLTNKFFVIYFT